MRLAALALDIDTDGSGLRGVFVQTLEEYAEFAASLMRRAMAAFLVGGGQLADGLVMGLVAWAELEQTFDDPQAIGD